MLDYVLNDLGIEENLVTEISRTEVESVYSIGADCDIRSFMMLMNRDIEYSIDELKIVFEKRYEDGNYKVIIDTDNDTFTIICLTAAPLPSVQEC